MKQKIFLVFLFTLLLHSSIFTQEFGFREDIGTIESSGITEASGIAASRKNNGVFWVHNDSGGLSRIFAFDSLGQHLGNYYIAGIQNRDWEDIAIGPGPIEGEQYIYIGDIGDNSAKYDSKYIYRILEPKVFVDQIPVDTLIYEVERLVFQYPDGNRNAETLMIDPTSKNIYVVSKETDTKVYQLSWPYTFYAAPTMNINTLDVIASLEFGSSAVGGDISPSGSEILIKSSRVIYYWQRENGETIEETLMNEIQTVPYFQEPQGEAVAWASDSTGYYTISEGEYPHLYFYPRLIPTDVINEMGIIDDFRLRQNYPNPFNPTTTISFAMNDENFEDLELVIYNIKGQRIKQLEIRNVKLGMNEVVWNGVDEFGKSISSGVYFYKLVGDGKTIDTKKCLLLK